MKHGAYLTYGKHASGKLLAVISDGSPQHGHEDVTVLTVKLVDSPADAKRWFKEMKRERPWDNPNARKMQ